MAEQAAATQQDGTEQQPASEFAGFLHALRDANSPEVDVVAASAATTTSADDSASQAATAAESQAASTNSRSEKPQAAAAPVAAPVVTPPAPKHSLRLAMTARDLGASEAAIEATSPEVLEGWVLDTLRQRASQPQQSQQPSKPAQPADPLETLDLGVDPATGEKRKIDDYDPGVAGLVRQLAEKTSRLETELQQQRQAQVNHQNASIDQQIDAAFAEVAKARPQQFTAKTHRQMDRANADAAEWQRRNAVIAIAKGLPGASVAEVVAKAAEIVYGPAAAAPAKPQSAADQALETRRQDWSKNGKISRPTSRAGARDVEPKGKQRAIEKVGEKMREMGMADNDAVAPDFSWLPE